jgi:hypothetical protein
MQRSLYTFIHIHIHTNIHTYTRTYIHACVYSDDDGKIVKGHDEEDAAITLMIRMVEVGDEIGLNDALQKDSDTHSEKSASKSFFSSVMHVCMYESMWIHTYIHTYIGAENDTRTYIPSSVCVHVHTYSCHNVQRCSISDETNRDPHMCVYIYSLSHIHAHIQTYTHTYIQL